MPAFSPLSQRYTPLVAGIFAFIVYTLTLFPDLTWAYHSTDGGELITAAVTGGIPHPPGYPTYVLLGKVIRYLPLGSVAFRFNLFSAICTSVAVVILALTLQATHTPSISLATSLSVAFASFVWQQAVVTEVYALNFLLVVVVIWAVCRQSSPLLIGFFFGLSLTTHLTSTLLVPLLLVRRWSRSELFLMVGGVVLGSLPWLVLPLLAQGQSPVQWGDAGTFQGWLELVQAKLYRPNVFGLTVVEMGKRAWAWLPAFLGQWAYVGWGVLLAGIVAGWQKQWRQWWPFLLSSVFYGMYAVGYDTPDAGIYLLPILALLAPFLAQGFKPFSQWAFCLPLFLLLLNFPVMSIHDEPPVRSLVETTLSQLPPHSLVLTPGDQSIFTLWYFHHVEGMRPDIVLVDQNLFAFAWYRQRLQTQYPQLNHLAEDDLVGFRTSNSMMPICEVSVQKPEKTVCLPASSH